MQEYRNDFPMLKQDYIYFNNASTTYKPNVVIDSISTYYREYGVNTNRGIDSLGFSATKAYENVRKKVADFIGSKKEEIIFTRGTTDSLNLIANSFGEKVINADAEIIISIFEHHANFIPWQELCKRKSAKLVIVKTDEFGLVDLDDLKKIINEKTKIVALNHMSNVMGALNNIKAISDIVHKNNAYLVIDGAQGIVHERINVEKFGIDFYAFSAHKLYGPMGVGVLYGKYNLLETMKPVMFGGEMIDVVTCEHATYKKPPYCFEAGTMMVPEVIGLGCAIDYVLSIGYEKINNYVHELRDYLVYELVTKVPNIQIYNQNLKNTSLITFNIKGIHAHDVATFLDKEKIIVRAGHHCAEPLMNHLKVSSTVRISLAFYNNKAECDKFIEAISRVEDYLNVLF